MLPKKPGPRSKTASQAQALDNQSSTSSSSSLSSGFLPRTGPGSGSKPQQVNQPQDPGGPSTSTNRPGILTTANNPDQSLPNHMNSSNRNDSGFVNRDDVTNSIRTGDNEGADQGGAKGNQTGSGGGGGGSNSSSDQSGFLDDNRNDLSGENDI